MKIRDLISGIGSLLEIFPKEYQFHDPDQSEEEAIAGDWQRIGDDMRKVMGIKEDES